MTEKELLELAAKAAGVVGIDGVYPIARDSSGECYYWNPLTDDGDALLNMKVKTTPTPQPAAPLSEPPLL